MTVKVTKPAINVREELADLRKPTGIAGEAMLRAETPQEQFNLIGAGRRNVLINGGMDVWQRATSHTTGSGYKSVDRWAFNTYTGGAFTVSKEVDSVHGNYLKWNRTSQDTSNSNAGNAIQQAIENAQYVIGGQYVTLSFWLKDEAGLGSGFIRIRQGASPYSRITASNQDKTWYSSSTDWEYHTFTFKIKSAADISMSNVQLLIRMDNGTAQGGVSITKVQLELGKVATPFEHRSYGEELAACQRYAIVYGGAETRHLGTGSMYTAANVNLTLNTPVTMRATPTLTKTTNGSGVWLQAYVGATGNNSNPTPQLGENGATNAFRLYLPGVGLNATVGSGAWVQVLSGASLLLDAEL
ncbi:hypothetical protein N9F49_00635 [bacterium]|nr:hypothetical protein [bacterium]